MSLGVSSKLRVCRSVYSLLDGRFWIFCRNQLKVLDYSSFSIQIYKYFSFFCHINIENSFMTRRRTSTNPLSIYLLVFFPCLSLSFSLSHFHIFRAGYSRLKCKIARFSQTALQSIKCVRQSSPERPRLPAS